MNWRRIGSSKGLFQSMILKMWGGMRIDIGAALMPPLTSLIKSSRVTMPGNSGWRRRTGGKTSNMKTSNCIMVFMVLLAWKILSANVTPV